MTGRSRPESSPEVEVKIHPRKLDLPPPPQRAKPPRPPPPAAYEPFKQWFPWLVPVIVLVNIGLFVYAMYLNNCPQTTRNCLGADSLGRFAFQPLRENPLLGPSAKTLLKLGALKWTNVVEQHQVWRIATCMWLHAGVVHVVANMVSLLCVGIRLEQEFGFARIGSLYVLAGIGGSMLSSLFIRSTISVGASGALFGLLGAMLSELFTNWTIYANKCAALMTLVFIITVNLAVGILPHVDNFAHLGGFITGFFLGFILLVRPQYGWVNHRNAPPGYTARAPKSKYKMYQYVLFVLSLMILLVGFIVGLVALLGGVNGNDYCSWCHYLSCFPTPFWKCDDRCSVVDQKGSEVFLTCLANGRSGNYNLSSQNATAEVAKLCNQLCG